MSDSSTNECGNCSGNLKVYCTRVIERLSVRVQYQKCVSCGFTKIRVVPLEFSPARDRKVGTTRSTKSLE